MLLSSPHHSAEKFSPPTISSGLRSLLVKPSGGVVVLTQAIAAASRGCGGAGGVQESRDGGSIGSDNEIAKAEEEGVIKADEEDEEDDVGCWVSYGRREPRRRLPPPIPSLLARGALSQTRTHDGRLIITIAPVVWRECIRARRRCGRLTMQREDENRALKKPEEDDTAASAIGEGIHDDTPAPVPAIGSEGIEEEPAAAQEMRLPVVPPPRVPSAGCFEDVVFKYSSIGGSSLHQMPSLRMVH